MVDHNQTRNDKYFISHRNSINTERKYLSPLKCGCSVRINYAVVDNMRETLRQAFDGIFTLVEITSKGENPSHFAETIRLHDFDLLWSYQ